VRVLRRALAEMHIAGVSSNVGFLQALVATRDFETNDVTTTFIEENMSRLCDSRAAGVQSKRGPPAANEMIESSASGHHQQLPAGSIPFTSPIRGRVSRLAVEVQGQITAGACVCVV
jgi:acetyl/propionyl-CoA carboxylase alpha subunit